MSEIKPFIKGVVVSCSYSASEDVTKGVLRRNDATEFCVIVPGDKTEDWVLGVMSPLIPNMQIIGKNKGRDVYKRAGKVSDEDGKEPTMIECSNDEYILTAVCTLLSHQTGEDPAVSLDSVRQMAAQWKALGYFG